MELCFFFYPFSYREELFMNQLLVYEGKNEELQQKVAEYTRSISGIANGEVGRSATVSFLKYGGIRVQFTMYAVIVGGVTHYLVSITNPKTGQGELNVFEGDWDSSVVMSSTYRSVSKCFPMALFKHRRGILKEFGELMYNVLTEFDGQFSENISVDGLTAFLTIDRYEVLTDLEWIEQVMEESSTLAGESPYRILFEHNNDDRDYIAYIPAVQKGVSGESLEDVLKEAGIKLKESLQDVTGTIAPGR
jgi:hypothetical protein